LIESGLIDVSIGKQMPRLSFFLAFPSLECYRYLAAAQLCAPSKVVSISESHRRAMTALSS
jgi:hypothetical protein